MTVVDWTPDRYAVRKRAYLVRYHHMTDGDGERYYEDAVFIAKDHADLVFLVPGDISSTREIGPAGPSPVCTSKSSGNGTEWHIADEHLIWWKKTKDKESAA